MNLVNNILREDLILSDEELVTYLNNAAVAVDKIIKAIATSDVFINMDYFLQVATSLEVHAEYPNVKLIYDTGKHTLFDIWDSPNSGKQVILEGAIYHYEITGAPLDFSIYNNRARRIDTQYFDNVDNMITRVLFLMSDTLTYKRPRI